jgi:hypothetical protein
MALSGRVISSSKLIHKRLYGHHTCRDDIMRVINISPNWSGSRMGVSHSMKLTPSGWKLEDRGGFVITNVFVGIDVEEEGGKDEYRK